MLCRSVLAGTQQLGFNAAAAKPCIISKCKTILVFVLSPYEGQKGLYITSTTVFSKIL